MLVPLLRCLLLTLALLLPRAAAAQDVQGRPNIILILADDLDAELGTLEHMPRLRRHLQEEGARFSQAFVTNSVCCPSRVTLLRGQYTHSHRVYTNRPPDGGFEKAQALGLESSTLATWLREAGYVTALLGKYLNGYGADETYIPPGWAEWHSPVRGNGYGMLNYHLNENGVVRAYGAAPEDYLTDVLGRKAAGLIGRCSADKVPFFLYIPVFAPHSPATPAPRHAALLPDLRAPRGGSFNEGDVSDKPSALQRERLSFAEIRSLDQQHRSRVLSMLAVDELIEGLIEALAAAGQLESTYILFTSDNGFHLGQHRLRAGKLTAYEEDIHVPLLVRGPGVPRGAEVQALVANVDLAPTIAELAGVPIPGFVEGRSLAPLLRGEPASGWRRVVLIEGYMGNGPDERPAGQKKGRGEVQLRERTARYRALRTATHAFVQHQSGERELYDLLADPRQMASRAAQEPAAALEAFAAWAAALGECAGERCRALEEAVPDALREYVR